ncbi:hypothetical protein RhiJN_12545 [Ceratobasidium sp. AG-Ba]|nr:hypothetical protein RhiJN_12545 [Ceratobasidium sp. AG-Ba]
MVSSEIYTVILRDTTFRLDRSQLEFDSPNYFTACFLGSFSESSAREIRLSRSPVLFSLIVDYLSGYTIFPLKDVGGMASETALENLLADALFYGLDDLVGLLESYKSRMILSSRIEERVVKSYLMVHWPQGLGSRKPPFIIRISESQAQNQSLAHSISPNAVTVLHSPGTAIINKLLRDQKIRAKEWSWAAFWTVYRAGSRQVECDCAVLDIMETKMDQS